MPGTYTVRLTVDGKTLTAPLKVVADPRGDRIAGRPRGAARVRAARARRHLEADRAGQPAAVRPRAAPGARQGARGAQVRGRRGGPARRRRRTSIKKADALEDKLHNPTAEVVYDILAMRGGTRLYSRLAPLQMWAVEAEGPPTAGMTQVLDGQEKELARARGRGASASWPARSRPSTHRPRSWGWGS